ncbi:MAG: glycosyltransferase family 4 protein [Candidatus Sumerlaeota bacterium]|nr:glycosyltransferase family 4 protein [Candidatus Sumerlaeota bacterium]
MGLRVLQLCAVDFTVRNFLRPLIYFLRERGFEVTAACSRGPHFEELRAEGIRMEAVPIRRSYDLLAHGRAVKHLTEYLRRERFDIVHVHTPVAALIGRIAATRAGTPIRIYTAHGFYFHERMPALLRRAHVALERFGARRGDFILTQSDEDRRTAIEERIAPPDRIRTIGNGVDLQRFSREAVGENERLRLRAELGLNADDRIVAVIGRLVPEKGYRELFDAALRLRETQPRVRLLVIGEALASDRIGGRGLFANQLRALGGTAVFAGLRSDVPALLSLAEVYTLPSYREGMPRSILEAMGMSLPVVATNIRGCREEVADGETGWLVPVGDAPALAERIGRLLRDAEGRRRMGEAGRRRAEALFDERAVLRRQLEVYEQLIREKGLENRR